jgi:hypothetical protein
MFLDLRRLIAALGLAVGLLVAAPAAAHQEHNETEAAEAAKAQTGPRVETPGTMHEMMEEHAERMEDRRPATYAGRLTRWLGQMHPFAVHFPIALFPVSWIALLLARRRDEAVPLIRALIIVAGLAALLAAPLGWVDAAFADDEPNAFLEWHRWIGTSLGLLGGFLALLAWRRPFSVQGRFMAWLVGLATLALLVQGWLGAVLVHGMEHMAF